MVKNQNNLITILNETDDNKICELHESMTVRSKRLEDVPDSVKINLHLNSLESLEGSQILLSAKLDEQMVFEHRGKSKLPSKAIERHLMNILGDNCSFFVFYNTNIEYSMGEVSVFLILKTALDTTSFMDQFSTPLLEGGIFSELSIESEPVETLDDVSFGYRMQGLTALALNALDNPKKIRKRFDYLFQEEFDGKVIPIKKSLKGCIIRDARRDAGLNRRRVEFYQLLDLVLVSNDIEQISNESWPDYQADVIGMLQSKLLGKAA